MISHGLIILINELKKHLEDVYNVPFSENVVLAGNLAEGLGSNGINSNFRDKIIFTLVNIQEESALKNQPSFARSNINLKVEFENSTLSLKYQILISATHTDYDKALIMLARTIRFFQSKSVFTPENIALTSTINNAPANAHDRLESYKLIFELYSPSMEEVNQLWAIVGGKLYPSAMYWLRIYDH